MFNLYFILQSVVLMFLYVEQDVIEFGTAMICSGLTNLKIA